jgi:hypothetical protein
VSAWGCSTTSWRQVDTVFNDFRLVVEIERFYHKGEPWDAGFAHPAQISPEGLEAYFDNLRYEYPKILSENTLEPLVQKNIEKRLVAGISEGLARCTPADRVRFAVTNVHRQFVLLPVSKTTRGVAFVKPAHVLNIAFDLVDDNPDEDREESVYNTDWEDPTRKSISTYRLHLPEGSALYVDPEGTEHPLWITIPFETLTSSTTRPPKPKEGSVPEETPGVPPEKQGRAAGSGTLSDQEGIHRLRLLRELQERGVITDEQFRQERERLFRQF